MQEILDSEVMNVTGVVLVSYVQNFRSNNEIMIEKLGDTIHFDKHYIIITFHI